MDHTFESQPRDSRLEIFSAAASNIISVECGLTATALRKIHALAKEQNLSDDQVIECLDRIGNGGSPLGRVGRYEQIFLDRLDSELSKISGAILSPQTAQDSIQLATLEYQISVPRAQQLLDHVAGKRGLQQISAADARNQIRMLIARRFESSNPQRSAFENELVAHGSNFGIGADEVSALLKSEVENRNLLRDRRTVRWIAVAASLLIAVGLTVAGCWLWLNSQSPLRFGQTTTAPVVDANPEKRSDAAELTIATSPSGSENSVPPPRENLSVNSAETFNTDDTFKFEIGDLKVGPKTAALKGFEKWQDRIIDLVGQNFEQSPPVTTPAPFADRQRMKSALGSLISEPSAPRIQARSLDDLGAISQRIVAITPEQAKSIAAFCFQKHSASVKASIVRNANQFGRWPHFLLAVSDAFADSESQSFSEDWNQRVAFAISDGKLKDTKDLSMSFFALARLRVQELLNEYELTQADSKTNVEAAFANHLRLFISGEMATQHHQDYFNRLIDARDLSKPSMQRQIELQQILIETLLFAKSDDASLEIGKTHISQLNSVATLGEQLARSRKSVVSLVSRHHQWLEETATSPEPQQHRLVQLSPSQARRLRDEAEQIAMSGEGAQIETAVAKYNKAIDCGDNAVIRSCLRGLIAIAKNRTELNRYQRQLDFVGAGRHGPYLSLPDDAGDGDSTRTDWRAIQRECRQLRRFGATQEKSVKPAAVKTNTKANGEANAIWATLTWLADRRSPLTTFELDLLLRIEAVATANLESKETLRSQFSLPNPIQATLPAVDVTPLFPLGR